MNEEQTKIAVGVITDLTKDAIKAIWHKVKNYYKDLDEKASIDFGDAYERYIQIASEKVRLVKSLIYRKEPRDLYTIYESVNLKYQDSVINTEKVSNILELGHRIIITGTAGIGKTTMMKHIFMTTVREEGYIPVFVELRGINNEDNKDINMVDLIYTSLSNCGFQMEKEYFEYSMEAGKYVILFDGFDEVKTEKSDKLGKRLRELCTKYPDNYYIMTSRPMDQFIGWNDFKETHTQKLNKMQALNLISKLEYDQRTKEKFMYELNHGLFERYDSFASNPLLLTIMLMTFDERASIPDKLNDFYEQAFATLFNIHDGSKDCFKRDICTGLGANDFKNIFSYFCFKTYFNCEYEFTENSVRKYLGYAKDQFDNVSFRIEDYLTDLVKSVCMLVKDGLIYTFSHRSFQEYFAACYTTKLEDSIQQKLISHWLAEKKGFSDDPYFLMLFNLQEEKFNKVLLCPGIKRIQSLYGDHLNIELFKSMFGSVGIQLIEAEEIKYRPYLTVKDNYLCSVLRMTCMFNGYSFDKSDLDCEGFVNYATNGRKLKKYRKLSFEEIEADGMAGLCSEQFAWVETQIQFAIHLLHRYEKRNIRNKRKVESIIDSL